MFFFKQKTAYEVRISDWSSDVCSSDLAFANRMAEVLKSHFPEGTVSETRPSMAGEDFGRYYRADKSIESFIFWVGGVPADRMAKAAAGEISLPSLPSPFWAPEAGKVIATASEAITVLAMHILQRD